MKLFLASSSDSLPLLVNQLQKSAKVIFIANASDNYANTWWVKADRDIFVKAGCEVVDVDLRKTIPNEFANQLKTATLIHFSGGSVLYLISVIRKAGVQQLIIEAVKSGQIMYSGTSAGSMITSKDLSLCAYDEEDKEFAKGMADFSGLGLVDFFIIPHVNNPSVAESNAEIARHLYEHLQPLIFLDDKKAMLVEQGKMEILSVQ